MTSQAHRDRAGDGSPVELSIVMPAYNEEATIEAAIKHTLDAGIPVGFELLVVENGSTDGTRRILLDRSWPREVRVLAIDRNRGKGDAVRAAGEAARGRFLTIFDADLEYGAGDISALLPPLVSGDALAVYGVRGFQSHNAYNFWYVMGGRMVTFATNVLYNAYLSDVTTCLKAMRTDLFRSLPLGEDGFTFDAEVTARLLRRGVRIFEVPVSYRARTREQGKKLVPADGLRMLRTLLRCRFDRKGAAEPAREGTGR